MAEAGYIQAYITGSQLVATGNTGDVVLPAAGVPVGKRIIVKRAIVKVDVYHANDFAEVFHHEDGDTEYKVWRKEDGLDPLPAADTFLDFTIFFHEGIMMEEADELLFRLDNTSGSNKTITAGIWYKERDE